MSTPASRVEEICWANLNRGTVFVRTGCCLAMQNADKREEGD